MIAFINNFDKIWILKKIIKLFSMLIKQVWSNCTLVFEEKKIVFTSSFDPIKQKLYREKIRFLDKKVVL